MNSARQVWDVVEPIAANAYFAPEVHRAFQAIGFEGSSQTPGGIDYPDGVAYFTSRGAPLGDRVSGHLVAAAFGVFKREMVVPLVAEGWARTDQATIPSFTCTRCTNGNPSAGMRIGLPISSRAKNTGSRVASGVCGPIVCVTRSDVATEDECAHTRTLRGRLDPPVFSGSSEPL